MEGLGTAGQVSQGCQDQEVSWSSIFLSAGCGESEAGAGASSELELEGGAEWKVGEDEQK